MGFEFVDRRGEKKAAEAAQAAEPAVLTIHEVEEVPGGLTADQVFAEKPNGKVTEFKKTVRGEVQTWKSTGFVVVNLPVGQSAILMVRAVGMRTDEKVFTADYAMPPVWEKGETFSEEAMKRLDTFKGCSCDERGRCRFHGEALPGPGGYGKWLESDMNRLQKIQTTALPECIEVLMKAEAARSQNRIVVPGRQ